MVLKRWEIVFKCRHLAGIFIVAFITAALYLKCIRVQNILKEKDSVSGCDLFSGRWVYDNISYPMYHGSQCPFIEDSFACERKGRKDLKYQNWRWQPHQCDLPRFNATTFLEKIRGRKIVYVGDSLMRNQWLSMVCLLGSAIPPSYASLIEQHKFSIPVPEYSASVDFHWSPLLVESNCDNPVDHKGINITLRIEAIENHAKQWNNADILVFDSYAWWLDQVFTFLWGSFGSPDAIYKKQRMSMSHFRMVMKTWADWLELNINTTKTTVYFMSMSPYHLKGQYWGAIEGQNCYGETEQILAGKAQLKSLINYRHMSIVESTIQELETRGVKVHFVDITHLSAYRKDAHPSIYGSFAENYLKDKSANPTMYSDCLHWCLPGVPDVWNQFLYAYIMAS